MVNKAEWVWMPHAGHLIVGELCRFRLNTKVGAWIVSTVGEYLSADQEICELGIGRTYETMVFLAKEAPMSEACCPWRIANGENVDVEGYNDAGAAYRGHLAMCEKWSHRAAPVSEEEESDGE